MKIGVQLWPQATTVKEMRTAWRAADAMGVDMGPLLSAFRRP